MTSTMIARVASKPDTQAMLKALRDAGLTVTKLDSGYECLLDGVTLFRAMNGRRNYLIRMRADLFA